MRGLKPGDRVFRSCCIFSIASLSNCCLSFKHFSSHRPVPQINLSYFLPRVYLHNQMYLRLLQEFGYLWPDHIAGREQEKKC